MNSYTIQSNNIETSYNNALASYNSALAAYNDGVTNAPVIASRNNVKLVGSIGNPGSLNYFRGLSVVAPSTDFSGYTKLLQISWNDDTRIIGGGEKMDYGPADHYNSYWKHNVAHYGFTDIINNTDTDITDVVHKNGTITLTNVATDEYGLKYDMKLSFTNTDNSSQHGQWYKSKVLIGRAPDDSFEFDFYGGFNTSSDGRTWGQGINISNIQFVYHNTNVVVPVFINSLFGDLDCGQQFSTTLSNLLGWTPNDSTVSQNGNTFTSTYLGKNGDYQGFKSTPKGTGLMIGAGSNFNYFFHPGTSSKQPYQFDGYVTKDQADKLQLGYSEGGVQFNLFGKGASLKSTPFPPYKQPITPPEKQHINIKKVSVSYHSNTLIQSNDENINQKLSLYKNSTINHLL